MRTSYLALIPALLISASAFAHPTRDHAPGKGGFKGPYEGVSTIAEVVEVGDDTPVMLTGYIITYLGDEKYKFKDDTGNIVVKIDHDKWHGHTVTPKDKIIVHGETEKDMAEPVTVDVERIIIAE